MDTALGISPSNAIEENVKALVMDSDPTNIAGNAKRAAVVKMEQILNIEFHAPGTEVSWFYPTVSVNNESLENRHD